RGRPTELPPGAARVRRAPSRCAGRGGGRPAGDGDGRAIRGERHRGDGGRGEAPEPLAGGDLPGGRAAGPVLRPEPGNECPSVRGKRDGPNCGRPGERRRRVVGSWRWRG